jgi:UDP-N-acetyl-D-glucosamine dehydrogenase
MRPRFTAFVYIGAQMEGEGIRFPYAFIELAGGINGGMPYFVVENAMEALSQRGKGLKGSRILVLGMAYECDLDDLRESPSLSIIELLQKRGALVECNTRG